MIIKEKEIDGDIVNGILETLIRGNLVNIEDIEKNENYFYRMLREHRDGKVESK